MTLRDLISLVRHYWVMVVCVSVGCAVVALLWSTCLSGRTYSAVATLEASDPPS